MIEWPVLTATLFSAEQFLDANEVIPRLWQGGKPAPGQYSFDLIVLAADEYQPSAEKFPGAQVLHVPLPDDWRGLTTAARAALYASATKAGETVAAWYRAGKNVLVTCGAGLNRSGLVNGLALRNLGYSGDDAVALIQRARGPRALAGRTFARFITQYQPPKVAAPTSPKVVAPKPSRLVPFLAGAAIVAVAGSAVVAALLARPVR
jgi:hypothetical protein